MIILLEFHSNPCINLVSGASWPNNYSNCTIDFPSNLQASSLFMVGEECHKRTHTRELSRISFGMLLSCHFSQFPQMENLLEGYFPSLTLKFFISSSHKLLYEFANHLSGLILTPPPELEGRNSFIWQRKSDDEYRWPGRISVFFSSDERHFIPSKWPNL